MDYLLQDNLTITTSNQSEILNYMNEDILYHCSSAYFATISVVGLILNTRAFAILASVIKVRSCIVQQMQRIILKFKEKNCNYYGIVFEWHKIYCHIL